MMHLLLHEQDIQDRVKVLARLINQTYTGQRLRTLCVLKGAAQFHADLIRLIDPVHVDLESDYIRASSYGDALQGHARPVRVHGCVPVYDRRDHVLIVDDICDTGRTLLAVKNVVEARRPASVSTITLLSKMDAEMEPDFYGFKLCNYFVVGYGMGLGEKFRELPDIYAVNV